MMISKTVSIPTADGVCDALAVFPPEGGPFPPVIFFMDGFGIRPYLQQMAEKLASHGYYVLLPNLFYRVRPSPIFNFRFPLTADKMPEVIPVLMPLIKGYNYEAGLADAGFFLDFLGEQKEVKAGGVGLTGYCMGGGMALRTAARYPGRVAAAASFHGGNLATDAPLSPHSLADQIQAPLYIAHADHDSSMPPEQQERLRLALEKAGLRFEIELFEGAAHGFAMADLPAYNSAALERHWKKLLEFFAKELKPM